MIMAETKSKILFLSLLVLGVAVSSALLFVTPPIYIWLFLILIGILLKEDSLARQLNISHYSDKRLSAILVGLFAMQYAYITNNRGWIMWFAGITFFILYFVFSLYIEKSEKNIK
jgi:hypothetical protein